MDKISELYRLYYAFEGSGLLFMLVSAAGIIFAGAGLVALVLRFVRPDRVPSLWRVPMSSVAILVMIGTAFGIYGVLSYEEIGDRRLAFCAASVKMIEAGDVPPDLGGNIILGYAGFTGVDAGLEPRFGSPGSLAHVLDLLRRFHHPSGFDQTAGIDKGRCRQQLGQPFLVARSQEKRIVVETDAFTIEAQVNENVTGVRNPVVEILIRPRVLDPAERLDVRRFVQTHDEHRFML